jgi:hypothetical protein
VLPLAASEAAIEAIQGKSFKKLQTWEGIAAGGAIGAVSGAVGFGAAYAGFYAAQAAGLAGGWASFAGGVGGGAAEGATKSLLGDYASGRRVGTDVLIGAGIGAGSAAFGYAVSAVKNATGIFPGQFGSGDVALDEGTNAAKNQEATQQWLSHQSDAFQAMARPAEGHYENVLDTDFSTPDLKPRLVSYSPADQHSISLLGVAEQIGGGVATSQSAHYVLSKKFSQAGSTSGETDFLNALSIAGLGVMAAATAGIATNTDNEGYMSTIFVVVFFTASPAIYTRFVPKK